MKNGVNWGNAFAIGEANGKNCPLITFVTFKTDVSIKWKVMYSRISC